MNGMTNRKFELSQVLSAFSERRKLSDDNLGENVRVGAFSTRSSIKSPQNVRASKESEKDISDPLLEFLSVGPKREAKSPIG